MATKLASAALFAASVSAHAFFHTGYVNGESQGHLFGVRAPSSNSPIQDVTSSAITCNTDLYSPVSTDVIEVAPGDEFGLQWNHVITGPTAGDADDPIASSHKGPVMVYMAKVDDASSNDGSGLSWFKVAEEGLDTSTGTWGVDTLIANAGLWSFTMPSLAAGDYLLRGELIALHSAGDVGGAQFYMSCAGIRVSGSGTCSPSDTVSFPGAYSATDPGIQISIYGNTGQPDNGGKEYTIPGPSVASCDGSSTPAETTTSASVAISTSVTTAINVPSSTSESSSSAAAEESSATTTPAYSTPVEATSVPSTSPTTFATVTGTRPGANSTHPWQSWTWSRPGHSNTRTRSSKPSSVAASSAPSVPSVSPSSSSSKFSLSASGVSPTPSSVAITASVTETNIAIPSSSSSSSSPVEATSATGTSPATPTGSGYSMTGPEGKKFVCYEVTDF